MTHSSILVRSTGNIIGGKGTILLSDALKSNTTLTQLNLYGKRNRNNTQMVYIKNHSFHPSNLQPMTLEIWIQQR